MNEPQQAPAPQPGQAPQPPVAPQQAPQQQPPTQAAPPAQQQTPPPGTPPAIPPAAAPIQPSPEMLALQKQNQEAQRKITELGQQRAEAIRQRDALVGIQQQQPQADPLAHYVDALVKKGYDAQQARDMVEIQHSMMQPVLQQQQQAAAAIQGTAMVSDVMRQAWTEMPQVFAANPSIGQRVEQVLRADALAGRPIDKDYALNIALIEDGRARYAQGNGAPPPAVPVQPPNFNGMWSPPAQGYATPQPPVQQKQWTDAQQRASDELKTEFFPKPKTA